MLQISLDSFGALVSNVAFPIAAFYLMYRMVNEELKELNRNVESLDNSIRHLQSTIQADVLTRADESLKYTAEDVEKWLEEKEQKEHKDDL